MSTNDSATPTPSWHRKTWVRVVLVIVLIWLLAAIAVLTADVQYSSAATPTADSLSSATVTYENVLDSSIILSTPDVLVYGAIPAKCHGLVWRRATIRNPIFTYGWRQTAIDQWCNNTRGVIYNWGSSTGNYGSYSGSLWEWKDVNYGKVWNTISRSQAKVFNYGVFTVRGRIGPTKTVNPRIYFHAATARRHYPYWDFGNPLHIYH